MLKLHKVYANFHDVIVGITLVLSCTVSEISLGLLQILCSWPHPYSTLILGVFPLHQIAHVGVSGTIIFDPDNTCAIAGFEV